MNFRELLATFRACDLPTPPAALAGNYKTVDCGPFAGYVFSYASGVYYHPRATIVLWGRK